MRHIGRQYCQGANAGWDVDVEAPAPRQVFGQIASDHWPDDGSDHTGHGEHRHRPAVPFWRIDVEQHNLCRRHQWSGKRALQHAEEDDLRKSHGGSAKRGGNGEPRNTDQHRGLDPKAGNEPTAERRHHGHSDDVGGEHPGDLLWRSRQAPFHVRQRDVYHGGIQSAHHSRQNDAERDRPSSGLADWGGS